MIDGNLWHGGGLTLTDLLLLRLARIELRVLLLNLDLRRRRIRKLIWIGLLCDPLNWLRGLWPNLRLRWGGEERWRAEILLLQHAKRALKGVVGGSELLLLLWLLRRHQVLLLLRRKVLLLLQRLLLKTLLLLLLWGVEIGAARCILSISGIVGWRVSGLLRLVGVHRAVAGGVVHGSRSRSSLKGGRRVTADAKVSRLLGREVSLRSDIAWLLL